MGEVSLTLFPDLLKMIFDEERKGPSEFATRGIIFSLLCKSWQVEKVAEFDVF